MKKSLLKTWLTMLCLLVGVGSAWGETRSITLNASDFTGSGSSYLASEQTLTIGGIGYKANNYNPSTHQIRGNQSTLTSNFYVYNTTELPGAVKSITITTTGDNIKANGVANAYTSSVSISSNPQNTTATAKAGSSATNTVTIDLSSNTNKFFRVQLTNGFTTGTCILSSISIQYEVPATDPYTVTFNVGSNGQFANGESFSNSNQRSESSAGAGVTLPNVTPNEGWVFGGWSAANPATSTYVTADANGIYKPSADITLYAYYKVIPIGPTFSPIAGEVEKGTSVSFSSTTEGCTFRYTTDGTDPDATTGTQASSCVINAATNLKVVAIKEGVASAVSSASYTVATHTATFSVNGNVTNAQVANGDAIPFPTNPQANDVVFVGWTYNAIDGTAGDIPSDICTSATMGTEDVTYYAVFASTTNTTFNADNITNTPAVTGESLSWADTNTGVKLHLSAGSHYTSGTPNTFTVTAGTTNYFQITSSDIITNVVTTISTIDYKINTVSAGKLNTSSTTQTISGMSVKDVKAYATSSKQIRATQIDVTTASDFCTTVKAVTGVAVKTAPTNTAYCEGDNFNPEGLEVTLTYEDASTKDIAYSNATASKFTFSPALNAALTTSDDNVSITINGQTCNQAVSVRSVSIAAPVVAEGTYTVKVGDAEAVTADGTTINALKGQKIVLVSTPASGYKTASTPFVVTDEDDANVSVSSAGSQYSFTMPAKNVTIAAKFTQVFTVAAGSCENGSITAIKDKDGNALTETSKGSTVKVEATADTHYHLVGMYYVKDGDDAHNDISEEDGIYSFAMPQSNVTVYATFADDTQYTISWMVNGAEAKSEQLYADVPVSAPAVEPVNGKVFRGWVAEEIAGTTNATPSYVNVSNMTVNEDKVFYAVFATEEGTPETHNIITYDTPNFPSSYAAAADYTLNGVSFNITQAYVNGQKTQWRAAGNKNGTGTMYNNDAMNISKITLTYNGDDSKNFTIKVGNSTNPTSGVVITGVADTNDDNVYVFDCSSANASYFVLINGSNAGYLRSIDITCGGATYSDYCTTVAAPRQVKVTVGSTGYATYYNAFSYTMPEGLEGKIMEAVSDGYEASTLFEVGDAVPAETALILKGEANTYTLVETNAAPDEDAVEYLEFNLLRGNLEAGMTTGGNANAKYYKLAKGEQGLGWYYGSADNTTGAAFSIGANKAYLVIDGSAAAPRFISLDGNSTAIDNLASENANSAIYNLAGQRVSNATKGIYIKNGKKYIVK